MQERARHRLYFILFTLICFALAVGAGLYALKDNISLFLTPTQLMERQMPEGRVFKLGGLVKEGSLTPRNDDLEISFTVTDGVQERKVTYKGIVPDLFREGQGVVATGALDSAGVFQATQLLAKHDEKYMPPELARGLKKAHDDGVKAMEK